MKTLKQLLEQMEPQRNAGRHYSRKDTALILEEATLEGAVLTAFRDGIIRTDIDGHYAIFQALDSKCRRVEDPDGNLLIREDYLKLDWIIWAFQVGAVRIERQRRKVIRAHETNLGHLEDRLPGDQNVIDELLDRMYTDQLRQAMADCLSRESQKRYFLARFRDGYTQTEMAARMRCSPAAVRAMEYRIRRRLEQAGFGNE